MYEFRCTRADLIAQQADGWAKEAPKYTDLTFTELGLPEVKLPFVFSAMRVELSADGQDVSGIVRRFDPKVSTASQSVYGRLIRGTQMLGEEGKRHRIVGEYTDNSDTLLL